MEPARRQPADTAMLPRCPGRAALLPGGVLWAGVPAGPLGAAPPAPGAALDFLRIATLLKCAPSAPLVLGAAEKRRKADGGRRRGVRRAPRSTPRAAPPSPPACIAWAHLRPLPAPPYLALPSPAPGWAPPPATLPSLPAQRPPASGEAPCLHGESQPLATVPFRECEETFSERGAHGASSPRGHRTCSASSWSFAGRPWPRSRSRLRESRLGRPHSPPVHLRNARGGSIPVRRVSVHQTSWP